MVELYRRTLILSKKDSCLLLSLSLSLSLSLCQKEIATHSNILAWKIPGTETPRGLWSIGLESGTLLKRLSKCAHTYMCVCLLLKAAL